MLAPGGGRGRALPRHRGRSRNTALILVPQNAGDLLNEQSNKCLSSVFAFRLTERGEVANVMSLLGVAASDEHKAVLRALGNGECIFRDLDDRPAYAAGSSGILGDLNNICEPSLPRPEQATGGVDAMVKPPAAAAGGKTLYDNYGVAGQFWAAHGLQCSDMTWLIGNNVAGMVFDAAKSIDRVTITVCQSAAGNNILTWLHNAVDKLIGALGSAIYFPFLPRSSSSARCGWPGRA